jgi:hypothetical protein
MYFVWAFFINMFSVIDSEGHVARALLSWGTNATPARIL